MHVRVASFSLQNRSFFLRVFRTNETQSGCGARARLSLPVSSVQIVAYVQTSPSPQKNLGESHSLIFF